MIISRAGSVLTETEEPAVLTPFLGTDKEPEPKFRQIYGTGENRNRTLEPRVTEIAYFHRKQEMFHEITQFLGNFIQFQCKLIENRQKPRDFSLINFT